MKKILLLLLMFIGVNLYGYINLYPTSFYKRVDKNGAYETFILFNREKKEINIDYILSREKKRV